MEVSDVLVDAFGRVREVVHGVLLDADDRLLAGRPEGSGNSVAWLVWHLTRVQDDHVADAFGTEQVWVAGGWARAFGLALPEGDTGYGHGPEEVAAVVAPGALLLGYHDAVHAATVAQLQGLRPGDLDSVVDTRWDPAVTLGVRLVSVVADDLQHAGQASYVRGLLEDGYDGPE
ncbi:chorismate synthase [Actinotalea ferrariae CF5-4]|uniref:Chorismate synthase n=1 Tax=Actinotalea ferrariae CF5-4 TaxID=948458 RepID=A0A021VUG0_9CELL|nr:DUF664 domain-containing protein [Actinotalea ferrariae]EYR63685.1 chorismate synthase [Actinotalea ferrariae CF5-4]